MVKKVISEKGGFFALKSETYVIGGKQEKDIEDIITGLQMPDRQDGTTSQEEDEEEGIVDDDDDELGGS